MTKGRRKAKPATGHLHWRCPPSGTAICNVQVADARLTDDPEQVTCGNCVRRLKILAIIEAPAEAVRLSLALPQDAPVHWTLGPCERPKSAPASNAPGHVTCGECLDLIAESRTMLLVQMDQLIDEAGDKMLALASEYSARKAELHATELSLKRLDMQSEHDEMLLEAKRILMDSDTDAQALVRAQQLQQLAGALRKAMPPGPCPMCKKGLLLSRRGPYGAFLGCSAYPDCRYVEDQAQAG